MMAGELLNNRGHGSVSWRWPSVHPEGRRYAVICGGAALFLLLVLGWSFLGWLLVLCTVIIVALFRDPERVVPQDPQSVIAPADGIVISIQEGELPFELNEDENGSAVDKEGQKICVGIVSSIFDVHFKRAPMQGVVRRILQVPGHSLHKVLGGANEGQGRQHLLIERSDGATIALTHVARFILRRIEAFVKSGDIIAAGQRFGLTPLGSRVEIYLPAGTEPLVILGQRVIAGETVLARFGELRFVEGRMS